MSIISSIVYEIQVIPFPGIVSETDVVDAEFIVGIVLEVHHQR